MHNKLLPCRRNIHSGTYLCPHSMQIRSWNITVLKGFHTFLALPLAFPTHTWAKDKSRSSFYINLNPCRSLEVQAKVFVRQLETKTRFKIMNACKWKCRPLWLSKPKRHLVFTLVPCKTATCFLASIKRLQISAMVVCERRQMISLSH